MDPAAPLDWRQIQAFVAIVCVIVGLGVAYLRLFVDRALASMRETLLAGMRDEYMRKDVFAVQLEAFDAKIKSLEARTPLAPSTTPVVQP